jgi:hypothetical protein
MRRGTRLDWLVPLIFFALFGIGNPVSAGWLNNYPDNRITETAVVNGVARARPLFYVGEPISFHLANELKPASGPVVVTGYEIRGYSGGVVESGALALGARDIAVHVANPGWYHLSVLGVADPLPAGSPSWGKALGVMSFCIIRKNPHFPTLPIPYPAQLDYLDQTMRMMAGIGPERLYVPDAANPAGAYALLDPEIALAQSYAAYADPARPCNIMISFPNGTAAPDKAAGVLQILQHYKGIVHYWEGQNEPNIDPASYLTTDLIPFSQAVHSVDPTNKVMGPAIVTIGPRMLPWLDSFLKAGGSQYLDVLSFHAYNNFNGDLFMARQALSALKSHLAADPLGRAGTLPLWQTEQGSMAACYGVYQPRLQAHWAMLQRMVEEQFGIPKEQDHYWYDRSRGYWDEPMWFENRDGSLNPTLPLFRMWAEELYGTTYKSAYDFGPSGNKFTIGSLFVSPDGKKQTAVFLAAGDPNESIDVRVTMASGPMPAALHTIRAFGLYQSVAINVATGMARLPVDMVPLYVDLLPGETLTPVLQDYGVDQALSPGVVATASGDGQSPFKPLAPNPVSRVIDGQFENWYYNQGLNDYPFIDDTKGFPAWVKLTFPAPVTVSRVVIYAAPPWQTQSTLLSYELQAWDDASQVWKTVRSFVNPTISRAVSSSAMRTGAESYFNDQWIFNNSFPPVTTTRLRILVHNTTYGGEPDLSCLSAGGQGSALAHHIVLREVEVY